MPPRSPHQVLLICNAEGEARRLKRILEDTGLSCHHVPCHGPALLATRDRAFDLVILRTCGPGSEGLCTLAEAADAGGGPPYIVLGEEDAVESAVLSMRLGAFDFLRCSAVSERLSDSARRALARGALYREARLADPDGFEEAHLGMVGSSPGIDHVRSLIRKVAPTPTTVLLDGETGTGKEVAARAIHRLSGRCAAPLVPVSCAALPEHLLESEMFGHRKGSFTGAVNDSRGLLEKANGGTLFLDEVETLTLPMQGKLLRAVEEKTVQRVGCGHDIRVDFRLIAATNDHLSQRVRDGSFREDLYYRLNAFPIAIPPLRLRVTDIPSLAEHFGRAMALEAGVPPPRISASTMNRLMEYAWPGNVRELKNCVERAFILSGGASPLRIDVPPGGSGNGQHALHSCLAHGWDLDRLEEEYIRTAIHETRGHRSRAAAILGIDRRTLYRKLRRLKVDPEYPRRR